MKMAESMKNITENIMVSHNARVRALGTLIDQVNESMADVNKQMKEMTANRKKISAEQASELAHFASGLAGDVGKKLKGFRNELEVIAEGREVSSKELHAKMQKEAKELRGMVNKTLGNFHKEHADMSHALKQNLGSFVKGIVDAVGDLSSSTRGMMKHYRDDIHKAGDAWRSMSRTLAKARGHLANEAAAVEGGESSDTVEGAVRRIKRRRKKK